jgi:hypothetical protein
MSTTKYRFGESIGCQLRVRQRRTGSVTDDKYRPTPERDDEAAFLPGDRPRSGGPTPPLTAPPAQFRLAVTGGW